MVVCRLLDDVGRKLAVGGKFGLAKDSACAGGPLRWHGRKGIVRQRRQPGSICEPEGRYVLWEECVFGVNE